MVPWLSSVLGGDETRRTTITAASTDLGFVANSLEHMLCGTKGLNVQFFILLLFLFWLCSEFHMKNYSRFESVVYLQDAAVKLALVLTQPASWTACKYLLHKTTVNKMIWTNTSCLNVKQKFKTIWNEGCWTPNAVFRWPSLKYCGCTSHSIT